MTDAYAKAAVNFDIPRFHQREIATLRAFDVMGSGGLLACETGTELDELFLPKRHFLTWSTQSELRSILERASAGEPGWDAIAAAGQEAVRRFHSLDCRTQRILNMIKE